jgi:hypothetical protein
MPKNGTVASCIGDVFALLCAVNVSAAVDSGHPISWGTAAFTALMAIGLYCWSIGERK